MGTRVASEIRRYLRTGDHDDAFDVWPGRDRSARAQKGSSALRDALIAEVRRRETRATSAPCLADLDVAMLARRKVEPMVRGLFPRREQDAVLAVLQGSVVFLTPANIENVLGAQTWLRTAWDLATLYLGSVGARLLARNAPRIVGFSEETTCFVSARYFEDSEPFADFVVHEAAHVFHNCKRGTVGLPETRTREWLLDIEHRKRETFAYACEAYSRILALADRPAERRLLYERLLEYPTPADERVDGDEYLDVVREATLARNGWKRILARCSSRSARRTTYRTPSGRANTAPVAQG